MTAPHSSYEDLAARDAAVPSTAKGTPRHAARS